MAAPVIDHRGPEFAHLAREVLAGVGALAGTVRPVALYPSSGTGAWEAALVNTLSPGDKVLMFETGHFAMLWAAMAARRYERMRKGSSLRTSIRSAVS